MADHVELDWLVMAMKPYIFRRESLIAASVGTLAAALLLACSGCELHPQAQAASPAAAETPAAPSAAAHAAYVPPAPAAAPDAKSFTTTGPLVAEQQADIAAERNGRVVEIAVQIGDRVKSGQVLALLDDRALRLACDAQKARIAAANVQSMRELICTWRSPAWVISTGSSAVQILMSGRLMWCSTECRVVVLPEPVGPQTRMSP